MKEHFCPAEKSIITYQDKCNWCGELESQEPVAWRAPNWGHGDDEWVYRDFDDPVLIADGKPSPHNEPLYTHPPQRTWVGLTDEEAQWLYDNCRTPSNLIDMVEAKLKELNT